MAKETGNPWLDTFTLVKQPDMKEPWIEFRCDKDSELFLGEFINAIGNVPALDENNHGLYFRGQTNAGWTLKPKLMRMWEHLYVNTKDRKGVTKDALSKEFEAIQYFQKRVRYLDDFYRSLDCKLSLERYSDWLALMQHYSAPTRLLDWTTSFYVALYFACQDDLTDGAVWILYKDNIIEYMNQAIKDQGLTEEKVIAALSGHNEYVKFGMNVEPILEIVSNKSKTDRIIAQGGIFTISYQLFYDHAQVGLPFVGQPKLVLIKLVIPSKMKKDIRKFLSKMDIFAERLFPGLDGIGRTIEEKICLHQEVFYPS